MLTTRKKDEPAAGAQGVNLIGEGTRIEGDMVAAGDVRIDGYLKGDLTTAARLVVGPNGVVEGQVSCIFAEIIGQVKGDLQASETLTLRSTARIHGNLQIGRLIVESGAVFSGSCSMSGQVKAIQPPQEIKTRGENAQTA